jgi:hypothetical protein
MRSLPSELQTPLGEYSGNHVWARLLDWDPTSVLGDPEAAFPREGWAEEEMPDESEPERYRQ